MYLKRALISKKVKCFLYFRHYCLSRMLIYLYICGLFVLDLFSIFFFLKFNFWGSMVNRRYPQSAFLLSACSTGNLLSHPWHSCPYDDRNASTGDRTLTVFFISVNNPTFILTAAKNRIFEPVLSIPDPFLPLFLSIFHFSSRTSQNFTRLHRKRSKEPLKGNRLP